MNMLKKTALILLLLSLALSLCPMALAADGETTLVYASGDYTRINPAMDEHGEINILLFNGLTAHDGDNGVIPALAESWDYDEAACAYTFHLRPGVTWHDGAPFTAEDVQFTIEAIMDPRKTPPTMRMWRPSTCWTSSPSASPSPRPTRRSWTT